MTYVLHLRGLPFQATDNDITNFLQVDRENLQEIRITKNSQGRPSGEAYVVAKDEATAEGCLGRHKETMANYGRYIEIFKSTPDNMNKGATITNANGSAWDGVVRIRGLPFQSTIDDVKNFFAGLSWVDNGIFAPRNAKGESTGEAWIQFDSYSVAQDALSREKQEVGGRYIDTFKSSNKEIRVAMINELKEKYAQNWSIGNQNNGGGGQQQQQQQEGQASKWGGLNIGGGGGPMMNQNAMRGNQRPNPYGRPNQPQQANNFGAYNPPGAAPVKQEPQQNGNNPFPHCVGINGLPPGVNNAQIQEFFKPNRAIAINKSSDGRSGDVAFKTHGECETAMGYSGRDMNGTTISLILKSKPPPGEAGGFQMLQPSW